MHAAVTWLGAYGQGAEAMQGRQWPTLSKHRGEYWKGFKLSQTFAKGQHVGYEATCYLHKAGDGWTCRRTCTFVKNNNPERRRS